LRVSACLRPLAAFTACLLLLVAARPAPAASPINVATISCYKYQNELLPATDPDKKVDAINTVMWLFGYSVAKTGSRAMFGDGLTTFGFALDAECKNNPNESLQAALGVVKVPEKNPMDLAALDCGSFAQRHLGTKKTDAESAETVMMWLFGFQVAKSNGRILDVDRLGGFETALLAECGKQPLRSVYDTFSAMKF
jgi:hypothetical protein